MSVILSQSFRHNQRGRLKRLPLHQGGECPEVQWMRPHLDQPWHRATLASRREGPRTARRYDQWSPTGDRRQQQWKRLEAGNTGPCRNLSCLIQCGEWIERNKLDWHVTSCNSGVISPMQAWEGQWLILHVICKLIFTVQIRSVLFLDPGPSWIENHSNQYYMNVRLIIHALQQKEYEDTTLRELSKPWVMAYS